MISNFFEVHGVDYSIQAFFAPQPPGGLLQKKINFFFICLILFVEKIIIVGGTREREVLIT